LTSIIKQASNNYSQSIFASTPSSSKQRQQYYQFNFYNNQAAKRVEEGLLDPVCNDDEDWQKKLPSAGELGRIEEKARESVATTGWGIT
jgi:hypothetical protein